MAKSSRIRSRDEAILRQTVPPAATPETEEMARCLAELARYYRHSAVGRRCSGIIHNMNTPLQVISFHLELLEQKSREEANLLAGFNDPSFPELAALHEYRRQKLEKLHHEVDNLRKMIHRITLQGVHEGQEEYCYLDLNQIFQDELELYLATPFFKHRVEKEFTFTPGLPPIHGHYVDFSQSFRHLVDNALEAMAESPRRLLTITTLVQNNCRVLRVGDTGVGIPPSVQSQLFQPFFTTKGTQEKPRAGLGLYMTRRMLAPYKGQVTIESQPGQTWVTICLPMVR
uniref:histidine kinase n=1 Tax=Desulfobacca acetoxidans TaxID=60893 RepID=A0A7V6A502_9BACT